MISRRGSRVSCEPRFGEVLSGHDEVMWRVEECLEWLCGAPLAGGLTLRVLGYALCLSSVISRCL